MLNSLEIKNFRNLKNLKINSLGRINLFTGKNNTGKSTILEAISIYASKGDLNVIFKQLNDRGEDYRSTADIKNSSESIFKTLSSLFTNRQIRFTANEALSIGPIQHSLSTEIERSDNPSITFRLVRIRDHEQKVDNMVYRRKVVIENNDNQDNLFTYELGLQIEREDGSFVLPLIGSDLTPSTYYYIGNVESCQLIGTRNIDREINSRLWDQITLSDKERYVIDALKIIEPNVERIAFIEGNKGERTAVIKLSNSTDILPLKSMGDGINRMLTIILALVNSDNGYLLVDEFENGLHYTIQEKLWEIIFNLSEILNIQVFATTHSEDCISGFERVLNSTLNNLAGKLIRLDSKNGEIRQVEFDAKELKVANEQDIEIR